GRSIILALVVLFVLLGEADHRRNRLAHHADRLRLLHPIDVQDHLVRPRRHPRTQGEPRAAGAARTSRTGPSPRAATAGATRPPGAGAATASWARPRSGRPATAQVPGHLVQAVLVLDGQLADQL